MHSGNLPGAATPGRETVQMKKRKKRMERIWQAGLTFTLLLLLCSCTKKEELLLLNGENAAEVSEKQPVYPKDIGGQENPGTEAGRDTADERQHVQDGESQGAEAGPIPASVQAENPGVIYVHVCGAVVNPGVYEMEAGSRVYEAVEQAGGFAEDADQNYVNQAHALEDGVKLVIPTREEAAAAGEQDSAAGQVQAGMVEEIGIVGGASPDGQNVGAGGEKGAPADGRININTASEAELCEIPGVGATRASAIAAYRESHGAFEKPEDIMKVNGIKEGMYEKIKDSISVK